MSAKVEQATAVDTHSVKNTTSSVSTSKKPMLKGKAGFVIPKNKFSGSLVPIFKGGKKSESGDGAGEESTKQVQRKTKWGPDLTQDTAVRRGRALAYQTRVDQITEQLKLGSLGDDSQSVKAGAVADSKPSTAPIDYEKLQALELERREAIGEILKLNPGYKAPTDYQPVMREAIVSIPVREHPGVNFVGLVCGADGDTRRRLEKETGSKIQVFGKRSETEEKVEVTASDSNELLGSYDELYVQISAESYEKVDAAAALIELLFSAVPGKSTSSNASSSVSVDNAQVFSEAQGMVPVIAVSSAMTGQVQPMIGSVSTSSQGSFHPYPGPWFPASQPNMPSGQAPIPSSTAFTFHPSPMHPVFGPRPSAPYGFGSSPQSIPIGPSRLHPPVQASQGPFVPPAFPLGQSGPPRNHSTATSMPSLIGQQPTVAGSPRVHTPQLVERPSIPIASSPGPGWAAPPAGGPQSLAAGTLGPPIVSSQGSSMSQSVSSVQTRPSAPSIAPQFPSQVPTSASSFVSSQIRSSSAIPVQLFAQQTPLLNSSSNTAMRPVQTPVPLPSVSYVSQSALPSPAVGAPNAPSFTLLKPMGGAAPRPPLPGLNDFTFQPQQPQRPLQSVPGPGVQFTSQRPPPPAQLPPSPQEASFRPTLQNVIPHVRPNFSRLQMGPPSGQFGLLNPNPNMGLRNIGPAPPIPNAGGSFPPRTGHSAHHQQNYPPRPVGRPGGFIVQHSGSSGRPQVYDPFSPTSVSDKGNNNSVTRKQESDPEYEDLMASVGVK